MSIEVKIPQIGESVQFAEISNWLVEDGDFVEKDQEVLEVDSDKATLAVTAEEAGKIKILKEVGEQVAIGDVVATVDTSAEGAPKEKKEEKLAETPVEKKEDKPEKNEDKAPPQKEKVEAKATGDYKVSVTPTAQEMIREKGIDVNEVLRNKILRITKQDVMAAEESPLPQKKVASRNEDRQTMSPLRKKLAERLVQVKNETAMLTTFNEVDLSKVMEIRKQYQKAFVDKNGFKVGFMSFFTKAVTLALEEYPAVNARLDGDEIVYHDFKDIGIAVSTPKGLMVPVIRNAETMGLAEIEMKIAELAEKARKKRLSMEEMTGGTFTITNGGVFGSMLSTPIINPPQVAILGMHNIVERPVAINGKVEIRPMMYIALSYDHRIIDGKESVSFLKAVKEYLEEPASMVVGSDPNKTLLGL